MISVNAPPAAPAPVLSIKKPQRTTVIQLNPVHYRGNGDQNIQPQTRLSSEALSFYHSGDLGDIIYALTVLKERPGSTLFLGPFDTHPTREQMTLERAGVILPLIRAQPYIGRAEFAPSRNSSWVNMNAWRSTMTQHGNLAEEQLKFLGMNPSRSQDRWISVRSPKRIAKVVFARSARYHNPDFDWKRILRYYGKDAVFVGLKEEHAEFEREVGPVKYYPTKDLLEVAEVIAGADLFVGNQSCPYAIAEGIKQNAILETLPMALNVMFHRPGVKHGSDAALFPTRHPSVVVKSPIDTFSGTGQNSMEIILGLKRCGYHVTSEPTRYEHLRHLDNTIPRSIAELIVPGREGDLVVVWETVSHVGKVITPGCVAFTIWESTVWPKDVVDALNKLPALIIVPCKWNRDTLIASGCKNRIEVCHLGIDEKVFTRLPPPKHEMVNFCCSGRILHGMTRKNIDGIIKVFQKTFRGVNNVRLNVKCFRDDPMETFGDYRIRVNTEFLLPEEIHSWYAQNHAFISLSRAEGWGLCLQEAMATGLYPIATDFGGQSEFFDGSVGSSLPYTIRECSGPYKGSGYWCEPDQDALAAAMWKVYDDVEAAGLAGKKASDIARSLNWETSICRLDELIQSV